MKVTIVVMNPLEIISKDSSTTEALGEKMGSQLKGGEVIELIGDVGAGKTTFVRGLARGLGSKDHVSSPTFTIYRVYGGGRFPLYHYDLYRMQDDLMVRNELAELATHKDAVIIVEWPDQVQAVLPRDHIKIHMDIAGDEERKFLISLPPRDNHIVL